MSTEEEGWQIKVVCREIGRELAQSPRITGAALTALSDKDGPTSAELRERVLAVIVAQVYPLVAAQLLKRLCAALGEPNESPADHPAEPPYRMTWDRALDVVRGRTKVWADLLGRAEATDVEWLNEYRSRAGSAVPVTTPGVALSPDPLDDGWVAEFTALAGAMSQGETIPDAPPESRRHDRGGGSRCGVDSSLSAPCVQHHAMLDPAPRGYPDDVRAWL